MSLCSAGTKTLLDLFEGWHQLAVHEFMHNGPDDTCPGCAAFTNNVPSKALEVLAEGGRSTRPTGSCDLRPQSIAASTMISTL